MTIDNDNNNNNNIERDSRTSSDTCILHRCDLLTRALLSSSVSIAGVDNNNNNNCSCYRTSL